MSDRVWYRSLYWRIAFGFVALLALLLLVQGVLFLWMTDRIVRPSSRSPGQLAQAVAADLSAELALNPSLPLEAHVAERFGHIYQPFLVVMADGRSVSNRPRVLPPGFVRSVSAAARRADATGETVTATRRPAEIAPIVVNGAPLGIVAVPVNPPPAFVALRELGPTLAWIAAALFIVGSAVMALVIFRPAQRRLRMLERAASALGGGRPDVRAEETGGDEVASLAKTFNRMADDLGARAAALLEADRSRRQLLADVSHELMTPLSAIRGYVETLSMPEVPLDQPTRQRYLRIVEDETRKLEAIIGDLLDLARLEGGGGTLARETVRVGDLFRRVEDRHSPAIDERHITMDLRVDPPELTVSGDAQRLEQAIQNLAANAVRHTPPGGRVVLTARRRDGTVHLTVRDTGPGIAPEHLPRVFDRFYKADASRTASGTPSGSGLGLSIVKAIVERHGGSIVASNADGGGAVFEVVLPHGVGTQEFRGGGEPGSLLSSVEIS